MFGLGTDLLTNFIRPWLDHLDHTIAHWIRLVKGYKKSYHLPKKVQIYLRGSIFAFFWRGFLTYALIFDKINYFSFFSFFLFLLLFNAPLPHVSFSFTGMAFLLLDYKSVVNCWRACGWAIFVVNGFLIAVSMVKIALFPSKKGKKKDE